MTPDFDELVGNDVGPDERARLEHAHELLVAAGPLPELPASLAEPPRPPEAEIVRPSFNRRRKTTIAVLAAAFAAAAFGVGFLAGDWANGGGFSSRKTIAMQGTPAAPGARASIALGKRDEAGNWQMLVRVSNLAKPQRGAYYTLWLTRNGRAVVPCGSFVVQGGASTTEVRFTVSYKLKNFDGWVVTKQTREDHKPGRALLRSSEV